MNVNLLTDAKKHNLALMKISSYHKFKGDNVYLNGVGCFDLTYGSWLFDFSQKGICDIEGGPGIDIEKKLPEKFEACKPDYTLFDLDYSVGFTWAYCPRKCSFCIVPRQNNSKIHNSIWTFHDSKFKKICLLNNNTFSDPDWKETFEEIWDADLRVIDENGYDLRLINEEKADALKKTKFKGRIHYAWDFMKDEKKIIEGLKIAPKGMVYVLINYNTTIEEDLYRCEIINKNGFDPYIMPFRKTPETWKFKEFIDRRAYWKYENMTEGWNNYQGKKFKRFIDTRMYRKYKTIEMAWKDYQ